MCRYEGEWSSGLRSGKGKYSSKSTGGVYDGEYEKDLKVNSIDRSSSLFHFCIYVLSES